MLLPPAGGLPHHHAALERARQHVVGDRQHEDRQDAGEHARAVEDGAVERHQIADAGRGGQHLGHHHADDGERAAEPQPSEHRRQRGRDDHARDLLRQRGAHAARGEQELRVDGADAGRRRQHDGEEAVDAGEGDLGTRADAEPGREDGIEDDDRHGVEAGEDRQQQVAQHGECRRPARRRGCRGRRRSASTRATS